MATRIAFSTVYPDRMGELAGKPTYFVEKLWSGLKYENHREKSALYNHYKRECKIKSWVEWDNEYPNLLWQYPPKTTTIRSNYEYWKSKEGQLLQPFFWAGKPYRSKHVVFCPEVRLERVWRVKILPTEKLIEFEDSSFRNGYSIIGKGQLIPFTQHEGFDHPDHFWMWFDRDFSGALLEFESVEG